MSAVDSLRLREDPRDADVTAVRSIVESTDFFREDEIQIACELVEERLTKGLASGYRFLFADPIDAPGEAVAYTCFGEIPCTLGSYDLYWVAVTESRRGQRIGQWLLAETERRVRDLGGRRLYIETSGRELYASTQAFYARCGYDLAANLEDYYAAGDPKLVYVKALTAPTN